MKKENLDYLRRKYKNQTIAGKIFLILAVIIACFYIAGGQISFYKTTIVTLLISALFLVGIAYYIMQGNTENTYIVAGGDPEDLKK